MKRYYKIFSVIAMFIFVFSLQGSFSHAEDNNENSQNNNLMLPISINETKYQVNKNLTKEQINERFKQINSMYKINEPFSSEDTEFIRAYASSSKNKNNDNQLQSRGITTDDFYLTINRNGVKGNFYGDIFSNIGTLNHSYGGNVSTVIREGTNNLIEIETTITNVAYGLLGNSGTYVGIVYDDSTSRSTSGNRLDMDRDVRYSAISVFYTHTNVYSRILTTNGDFDIYAF